MSVAGQPWMKFYPADWRADPALRVCSIAARGLWMEMLCLMHEAEPRGSLLVSGKQVTECQLASLVGIPRKLVVSLLAELEEANVFSRDDNGTVFSRRMRRDIVKAEKDKANGRAGGNPNLKQGVNPPDKAQKPEARSQRLENKNARVARVARSAFEDEFWPKFPHKVGKPLALRSFEKLWRELDGDVTPILDGLERYIRSKPPDRPWLNPATFLNQRRFEDQPAANGAASCGRSSTEPSVDFGGGVVWPESTVKAVVAHWKRDGRTWPTDRLGPPPHSEGCRLPPRLLEEAA